MTTRPKNPKLSARRFVASMYEDGYFPNHLVQLLEAVLLDLCVKCERRPDLTLDGLYELTHAATEQINELQELFWEAESEIETGAREALAEEFDVIAKAYGFEADLEVLIAPRDW